MNKVTFFLGGLSGGGSERVVCNFANYLCNKGIEIQILTVGDDESSYSLNKEIKRICLTKKTDKSFFFFNLIKRIFRFLCFIRKNRTDVYVVFLPVTTILILLFKFMIRSPVVASERALPSIYSLRKQKMLRRLAHLADGWVFQTQSQEQWYGCCVESVPKVIIPNAINEEFLDVVNDGVNEKIVVSSGRLTKQKNHALLIKAFALVLKKIPDYKLIIYGEGPERGNLESLISLLNLRDKVLLPGYSTEIKKEMCCASLFVLSSDYEGMPNALMEAMALGIPCISTDCGGNGAKYLIENGVNGLLVPVQDEKIMAESIEKILINPELAKSLGENARKIRDRLSPEKIYGEWENFILSLVKNAKE